MALDFTVPPVRVRFDQAACLNARGELDAVLLARVEPGEHVHELTNGDCYLRVGDESRKLTFLQRQELYDDRGPGPYDGTAVSNTGVSDLDEARLRTYRTAAGASGTFTRLLRARSLLTARQELTVAAYLLFAEHPQDRYPHAHVRVLRYRDLERGTGARQSLDDNADFRVEGPLPTMIDKAAKIIEGLVPRRRALSDRGAFEPLPIVPRAAWLEGLVNAVIHRSYSAAGDHIRVEIFPDRIEIESPGRFPGLVDPARPLEINRYARNPRIARVCTDLRIGQELGEGIRRIFEEMRERGLSDPVYRQSPGSVRLMLYSTRRLDPTVAARLPRGAVNVLEVLRQARRPLGTGDVVEATGLTRPPVLRHLAALRHEGLIEWHGRSSKDPRATWSLSGG